MTFFLLSRALPLFPFSPLTFRSAPANTQTHRPCVCVCVFGVLLPFIFVYVHAYLVSSSRPAVTHSLFWLLSCFLSCCCWCCPFVSFSFIYLFFQTLVSSLFLRSSPAQFGFDRLLASFFPLLVVRPLFTEIHYYFLLCVLHSPDFFHFSLRYFFFR